MMERLSTEQRTKVVQFYFESQHSIIQTQRSYRNFFHVRNAPSAPTIYRLVQRFGQQGAVCDLPRAGRPRAVRNEVSIARVQASIEENPETSTRRRSQQLGMSRRSLQRILHMLHLFPYKMQLVHELKPNDAQERIQYSRRFQELCLENNEFIHKLIMSDEAHFHLNGHVNKQNCRIWGSENPRIIVEDQMHPLRCTVWCGITSERIIGPYFFENDEGVAINVNGIQYREMIENLLRPAVQNYPDLWFQQDGATAHTARPTMAILREIFGSRIISRFSDFKWPPRSPDLTAPDFFLWGYLKGKVYANKPRTIQQLKANIREEVGALGPEILRKVMENALERALQVESNNGLHLKDIIFKT